MRILATDPALMADSTHHQAHAQHLTPGSPHPSEEMK